MVRGSNGYMCLATARRLKRRLLACASCAALLRLLKAAQFTRRSTHVSIASANLNKNRLPAWLRKSLASGAAVHATKTSLRARGLHTVCEEARCPNLGECFARGTAVIMIMGNVCTRNCGFCAVANGAPNPIDPDEPRRVAVQIGELKLAHAVITSVTRDDLPDGGAAHFAQTIQEIRKTCPETTIEVLTPDFEGREGDVAKVCEAHPHIFNHNIETVERLTPTARNKADYRRSLNVLRTAGRYLSGGLIKSGFMLGLGETPAEIRQTMSDLALAGCDILTIGQYLRPSKNAIPVKEYLEPKVFLEYKARALGLGFKYVFSGPFVRSSYMADKVMDMRYVERRVKAPLSKPVKLRRLNPQAKRTAFE